MSNLALLTTDTDFDDLHTMAEGRKHAVRLDREKLKRLLVDYTVLYNAVRDHTALKVSVPKPARVRVQLK